MKPTPELVRIRIDAPSGGDAMALERRLAHLSPTSVAMGDAWQVELDDDGDRLDEILAAVRHWLEECEIPETDVHVGTSHRHIARMRRPG